MENTASMALIERFSIKGLHGYKDLSIDFSGAATIIVAENGMGKTTLLNILNAFLTRRFHRLASFSFGSIECLFVGKNLPLVLERSMLGDGPNSEDNALRELAESASMPENELSDFMTGVYRPEKFQSLQSHPIVRQIYYSIELNWEQVEAALDNIHAGLDNSFSAAAKLVSAEVLRCVGDIEIVFLPTYRRVERPQLRPRISRSHRHMVDPAHVNSNRLDDIVFGLSDVEEKLVELSDEIERRSNQGYRTLSTRILDEMLKGSARQETVTASDLPDVKSLSRFLNRVTRHEQRFGGVFEDIENLYATGAIENADNWFLRYFLSRLAGVIEQTREMEQKVEQFVSVCNSYLTLSSDEKALAFDPQTLRVVVEDLWAKRVIGLELLSSGEKQIVSLMARLYLSSKKKMVLIDEPELSLSLDWQRKVLPDITKSGSVVQLFAITHSPFVYDNELDGCARALKVIRNEVANV
ncbi:AAA family ATPase [Massilia sp. erpn]|uniref:AAA family ATPase n=1 Tax=Massilia sp. erpn TaxID=2738142 RepID=UPI002107BB6D|nr:AAA family ATPase [Massilia sp. erpn]UTY56072.1 AAA family ATPase [Massilia sp. erpn]